MQCTSDVKPDDIAHRTLQWTEKGNQYKYQSQDLNHFILQRRKEERETNLQDVEDQQAWERDPWQQVIV